jgi:hypothetical protein
MDSEEVRVNKDAMDVDTAETIAGWCVSFDKQQHWLGLPQTGRAPDRLDSCSLLASTWPPMRPGNWSQSTPTWPARDRSVMTRPGC